MRARGAAERYIEQWWWWWWWLGATPGQKSKDRPGAVAELGLAAGWRRQRRRSFDRLMT